MLSGMVITTAPANRFGRWLLERFAERKWESYRRASEKENTGISHTQLSAYVQEGVVPRPPQLERLAECFGVERAFLEELLGLPPHGLYAGGHTPTVTVISGPSKVVVIQDEATERFVLHTLAHWRGLTPEQQASMLPDETEIQEPPPREGEGRARRGGSGGGGTG